MTDVNRARFVLRILVEISRVGLRETFGTLRDRFSVGDPMSSSDQMIRSGVFLSLVRLCIDPGSNNAKMPKYTRHKDAGEDPSGNAKTTGRSS